MDNTDIQNVVLNANNFGRNMKPSVSELITISDS